MGAPSKEGHPTLAVPVRPTLIPPPDNLDPDSANPGEDHMENLS